MILHQGKRYNQVRVLNPTPLDVNINGTTVVNDTLTDVDLTLVDQDGENVPFTQTGTKLEINTEWVRPTDWLPIDHLVNEGDHKFAGLFAVFSDRPNIIAVHSSQAYTVDWGDGTIINYNAGVVAEKTYRPPEWLDQLHFI